MIVQPSADGPAAWNSCPSGRLPSLGCTAAIDASYCSFVPPGKLCTMPYAISLAPLEWWTPLTTISRRSFGVVDAADDYLTTHPKRARRRWITMRLFIAKTAAKRAAGTRPSRTQAFVAASATAVTLGVL